MSLFDVSDPMRRMRALKLRNARETMGDAKQFPLLAKLDSLRERLHQGISAVEDNPNLSRLGMDEALSELRAGLLPEVTDLRAQLDAIAPRPPAAGPPGPQPTSADLALAAQYGQAPAAQRNRMTTELLSGARPDLAAALVRCSPELSGVSSSVRETLQHRMNPNHGADTSAQVDFRAQLELHGIVEHAVTELESTLTG